MGETYRAAGVDLGAGEEAVARIAPLVRATFRPEVVGDIGGFGALFALAADRFRHPVLVASTDGVGTKAAVAAATGRLDTIGLDLVAMCVDDVAAQGAEPLFLLDYVSVGRLDPAAMEVLVSGVAEGCRQAGCALIGGEMAEHPREMRPDQFDLVGFAVGVVERHRIVTGKSVSPGDVLMALPSPGLRSNGYSLARRVLLERATRPLDGPAFEGATHSLADELLRPSVIYAPAVHALCQAVDVHAIAHITGGGIPGNLTRVLPEGCEAVLRRRDWDVPPIFAEIQRLGEVSDEEMARVFNLGLGMIIIVSPADVPTALRVLSDHGRDGLVVGEVVAGTDGVSLVA